MAKWSEKMDWQVKMKKIKLFPYIDSPSSSDDEEQNQEEDEEIGEDRLSSLPDELIHHILSFLELQLAVETSILSKRWKLIWTTLPSLNFTRCITISDQYFNAETKFIHNFLSRRNHESDIFKLHLSFRYGPRPKLVHKFISYAILHNVELLNLDIEDFDADSVRLLRPNCLSSDTVETLISRVHFGELLESECWDLPALTTLHLIRPYLGLTLNLPESYLTCLSSLQILIIYGFELPDSISLPNVTYLRLSKCQLPTKVWSCPALSTLILDDVVVSENKTEFFPGLVNLRNLTWFFQHNIMTDCCINSPQLVNLSVYANVGGTPSHCGGIMVLAPKIRNFSSCGFFPITFTDSELENVNIKVGYGPGYFGKPSKRMKKYYRRVTDMFQGLGSAKILTFDSETIEALSAISDFLVGSPSPFYNLKYVKVPRIYEESSMSTELKCYLLGRSPKATIVTTIPQVIAQNVVLREPLEAPTKVLVGSEIINKTMCVDTLDMGVQQEHVVQNSVATADRVKQISAPAEGTGNVRGSSSSGNLNFGLWRGHEVNSEFVCLLDLIMNNYPETFKHFPTKNKKVCTMKLNMLCTSVNDFTKISLTDVDTEMIAEYRDVFASLQKFGFNVSWLVSRLNYIEQLRFSQPLYPELHGIDRRIGAAKSKLQDLQISIDDTKTKLLDLQSLRAEKMQEIKKAFGTIGTNLIVGYIGDDLFSGP